MVKMFWVVCPTCTRRFYVHAELRHTEHELLCPFCGLRFHQEDSPEIWGDSGSTRGW